MRRQLSVLGASVLLTVLAVMPPAAMAADPPPGGTRMIPAAGTTSMHAAPAGTNGVAQPELRPSTLAEENGADVSRPRHGFNNGIFPKKPLDSPKVKSTPVTSTNPEVAWSAAGLNHVDQRLANGGNQWSLEPPDQGLCVGNGYLVETVNSVVRVRSSRTGSALTGVIDLNTFFGYPAAIDRTSGVYGPDVIDPQCYYDPDYNRFILDITTLGSTTDGSYTGKNWIDVAVSNTGNPTGTWTIYHVPAQNDGSDGTPDHGCKEELPDGTLVHGPCFQDYPHIGGDRNGVYITTNEYDTFGPSYNAAQVFAFSKKQLAAHPAALPVTLVENLQIEGTPGWTVWPAISNKGDYENARNGTEYLLSTIAGDGSETGNPTGTARRIGLWAITNTRSLNSAAPSLRVSSRTINSETYVYPPTSNQKSGSTPLADCLNDNTLFDPVKGIGCWYLFFDPPVTWQPEVESHLDSGDSRMQQVWYADGMLWGSSGTEVKVGGKLQAGIAWFAVAPKINGAGKVEGQVKKQGYLALANNNLTYPAIAMTAGGKGVIAFTIVGKDYYPSAGYATIDANGSVGKIHIAANGLGPSDGFTSYKAFVGDPPRTRWGDYGAAVTDGSSVWIASEYIAQTCTLDEYLTGAVGSCGGTRTALANWATRVTKLDLPVSHHGQRGH